MVIGIIIRIIIAEIVIFKIGITFGIFCRFTCLFFCFLACCFSSALRRNSASSALRFCLFSSYTVFFAASAFSINRFCLFSLFFRFVLPLFSLQHLFCAFSAAAFFRLFFSFFFRFCFRFLACFSAAAAFAASSLLRWYRSHGFYVFRFLPLCLPLPFCCTVKVLCVERFNFNLLVFSLLFGYLLLSSSVHHLIILHFRTTATLRAAIISCAACSADKPSTSAKSSTPCSASSFQCGNFSSLPISLLNGGSFRPI